MATYVNDLRLTELATGEGSGTWGTTTNVNLELIGEALGFGTQDGFATDADATTTVADGASDPARAMYFKVTSSATLTATRTLTIAPNTVSRVMLIENATTGSQSIAISQGSGGNVTIASGQVKMVYLDGAGATAAVVDALADLELGTITVANLTATTADINGGTIDGVTIGGSSAGAGSFTTLTASGDVNFDSGTLFVDASADNVGIGTSSPSRNLDIQGTGDTLVSIVSPAANQAALFFGDTDSDSVGRVAYDNSDNSMRLNTNGSEAMRIDSSGSVGIGTTSPQEPLSVESSSQRKILATNTDFASGTTGTSFDIGFGATSGNTYTDLRALINGRSAWGDLVLQRGGGNVGIGTSSPSEQLHIANANDAVVLIESTGSDATDDANIQLKTTNGTFTIQNDRSIGTSGALTFAGNTSNNIVIDHDNGNVGVGTSSPSTQLHVNEASTNEAAITLSNNDGTYRIGANNDFGLHFADSFKFANQADTAEYMRIDSSGDVGIGTTSPARQLHVKDGSSYGYARVEGASGGFGGVLELVSNSVGSGTDFAGVLDFYMTTSNHIGRIKVQRQSGAANSGDMLFYTASSGTISERMRIDSSGNLLVGTTSTGIAGGTSSGINLVSAGAIEASRNDSSLFLNRTGTDGTLAIFRKDGTTVGSIGVAGSRPYLSNTINFSVKIDDFANGSFIPADEDGATSDNVSDIGSASARWDDIYATNGTIQTSDANEKQDIEELSEAERRVAVAAKGLLRKFRWISSVEEKGDEARIHFGIIAQDLQAAFEAEGLDAGRYAMFTHTTWTDEETGEERSRMGVRYSELLAFIIAAL